MASRNNMDDKPDPNDILIAVMGATGAGKSTLISHCTDEYVPIGSDLQSHTSAVASYPVATQSGQKIYLVDTPGFDDTNLDDADVLKLIASWLNKRYEQDILLRGILYLHKISDNRMTGTARKNLRLMKKICGKDALKNIILTTTMWEKVEPAEGHDRERQLVKTPEYWGDMIQNHGSRVERCFNTKESAMEVVESLLSSGDEALAIQKEMANGAKKLNETTAGMTLNEELEKEREKFSLQLEELRREFETSRKEWDEDAMMQIQQEREDKQREIDEIRRQQEKMKVENDEMNKQMQEQALAHCAAVVQLQAQQEQMLLRPSVPLRPKGCHAMIRGVDNAGHAMIRGVDNAGKVELLRPSVPLRPKGCHAMIRGVNNAGRVQHTPS
ncbi:hypothetical protein PFICI_02037 [Pestalotiopsis fici W106-1]|uniref:G domain-containing protein n=1 Tax=Pestalotiopsis fici (strain W106-1 / CGMCC3.15140) TaxID=1229662 RepID=W3XQD6_PESFW|nr:uncharacterized protein PFICI_02037 [Pestalotiopsis fici W106-1]ETS88209.1 hypothetical protein PFICI_02037 [Pestalotiopsis fici W106-1]